jgi:serine/threonine protein kinase
MSANPSQEIVIDDRFEIKLRLPDRHFCKAYSAFDRHNQIDKLLLVVPREIENDIVAREELKQSTINLLWLTHPGIARFFGLYHGTTAVMIETELLRGENLKIIKHNSLNRRLPENKVIILALKILDGLAFAHNQNVLHKGLTPSTIFLTRDYKVKILDFSYAEALYTALSMVRDVTYKHPVLYMSPEQAQGRGLTVRSDIYSFGAVLYDLLAGQPPFLHGDVYNQVLRARPLEIEGVSAEMNQILQACLAKDMSNRFASCTELIDELTKMVQRRAASGQRKAETPSPAEKPSAGTVPQASVKKSIWKSWRKSLLAMIPLLILGMLLVLKDQGDIGKFASQKTISTPLTGVIRDGPGLMQRAERLYRQNLWFGPPDSSSLFQYKELLKLHPQDNFISSKIDSIRLTTIRNAGDLLRTGQFIQAGRLLGTAAHHFMDDIHFKRLCDDSLRRYLRIDVLNGTGKNGIARQLAARLRQNGYPTGIIDNLYLNGRRKNDLKQSYFIQQPGLSILTKGNFTGLNFREYAAGQSENVSDSSSHGLIVGEDFQQLLFGR